MTTRGLGIIEATVEGKDCSHCGEFYFGTARSKYCKEICKQRAKNQRRMSDPQRRESRLQSQRGYRQAYRDKNPNTRERKYPGDPDWRKRPRSKLSPEEKAEAKRENRRLQKHKRRALSRGVQTIPYTVEQLSARFEYWHNKCWMCGASGKLQIDHVKPLSKGGPNMLSNYRPACGSCNARKRDKWPI